MPKPKRCLTILEVQDTLPLDLTRTHKRHVIDIHEQKGKNSKCYQPSEIKFKFELSETKIKLGECN